MDVIHDIWGDRKRISYCIKKYGSVREHNFWFFYNQDTPTSKVSFIKYNNSGFFTIKYSNGTWELIGETMVQEKVRVDALKDFISYVLNKKKDKNIFFFIPDRAFMDVQKITENSKNFRITGTPIVYYTPVFNLKKWDEGLKGKEYKKLRNVRNKFMRTHKVEFIPSKELDKEKLHDVVMQWKKKRQKIEMNYYIEMYQNYIDNEFRGTDISRSMVVDGVPCTITSGWKIPNSKNYYSGIGLYNYKYDGMGEVANIDDLRQIKKRKFLYADFGDSTKSLLQFKKKFGPESYYKTYWFYVGKK